MKLPLKVHAARFFASAEIERVLKTVPMLFRSRFEKHLKGGLGRAQSMNLKCAECVGFEDVVQRVKNCATWKCPLWNYRPYQERDDGLSQDETGNDA
jgi:hypothetical protein